MLGYSTSSTFSETVLNFLDGAQATFNALPNDEKRLFTDENNVTVTFNPATPNMTLVDANQTYDVTVTFEADGGTRTSTYEETILAANYSVTSNTDWLKAGNVFESQNHTDNSTSILELTMVADSTINYTVSSESCCDKLRVTVNGTVTGDYGDTNGTFNVLLNDLVKLEYHKDGSVSSGTDNAIVTFQ